MNLTVRMQGAKASGLARFSKAGPLLAPHLLLSHTHTRKEAQRERLSRYPRLAHLWEES